MQGQVRYLYLTEIHRFAMQSPSERRGCAGSAASWTSDPELKARWRPQSWGNPPSPSKVMAECADKESGRRPVLVKGQVPRARGVWPQIKRAPHIANAVRSHYRVTELAHFAIPQNDSIDSRNLARGV